jgi:hypothetical protein
VTDLSYRQAIAEYGRRVAAGEITFDAEGFADSYPGRQESGRSLAAHLLAHMPVTPTCRLCGMRVRLTEPGGTWVHIGVPATAHPAQPDDRIS